MVRLSIYIPHQRCLFQWYLDRSLATNHPCCNSKLQNTRPRTNWTRRPQYSSDHLYNTTGSLDLVDITSIQALVGHIKQWVGCHWSKWWSCLCRVGPRMILMVSYKYLIMVTSLHQRVTSYIGIIQGLGCWMLESAHKCPIYCKLVGEYPGWQCWRGRVGEYPGDEVEYKYGHNHRMAT